MATRLSKHTVVIQHRFLIRYAILRCNTFYLLIVICSASVFLWLNCIKLLFQPHLEGGDKGKGGVSLACHFFSYIK